MALEEKGFKVTHPTLADLDTIWAFLVEHFLPDEPFCRSFGVLEKATWVDRFVQNEMRSNLISPCLENDTSILLWDSEGEIAGVKLGHPISITDPVKTLPRLEFLRSLRWIIPEKLYKMTYVTEFLLSPDYCHLEPRAILKNAKADKVFFGEILCVSKEHRGKRLSTDLIERSMKIAQDHGCQGYIVQSTGIYSQNAYQNHAHFELLKELKYADFKDGMVKVVFNDTREHKTCKILYKTL
ncbi:hypothetical protein TCAL_11185 [Tigriopus californicus]|uniref:N-acetyltransferase domain-containing protein n=2 Tax=Tigriopus californicus TaxID=6832 RepID=A0A553P4W8_TIGCA|nr:hypothetical protein TCAL_11185 [Tigriopus californicus]|eukprot:TCALIF_11185-PA protein Name:"Protein of unknown function" AED:0.00 eAED:0.00 QI:32/1/1/1/1/1/2/31/239